jgi:hypothetical protein
VKAAEGGGRDMQSKTTEGEESKGPMPDQKKTIKQVATINARNGGAGINSTLQSNGGGGKIGTNDSSDGNGRIT